MAIFTDFSLPTHDDQEAHSFTSGLGPAELNVQCEFLVPVSSQDYKELSCCCATLLDLDTVLSK